MDILCPIFPFLNWRASFLSVLCNNDWALRQILQMVKSDMGQKTSSLQMCRAILSQGKLQETCTTVFVCPARNIVILSFETGIVWMKTSDHICTTNTDFWERPAARERENPLWPLVLSYLPWYSVNVADLFTNPKIQNKKHYRPRGKLVLHAAELR